MGIETDCLTQKAVLFPKTGYDDFGRHTVDYTNRVQISTRWETRQTEVLDPQNNTIGATDTVYVDRVIAIGSVLWKGALTSMPAPYLLTDLKQVIDYKEIPDVKGQAFRRVVLLLDYSDDLPGTG